MTRRTFSREDWIAGLRAAADALENDKSMPVPATRHQFVCPVPPGSDDERRAAVDEFAAAHGLIPGSTGEGDRTYQALAEYGPVGFAVYYIPDAVLDEIAGFTRPGNPVAA